MRRRVRAGTAALLAAAWAATSAPPAAADGRGELTGRFTSLLAYRLDSPREVSERDVLLDLEGSYAWGDGWKLRALGRGRFEDRLAPEAQRELDLRELVLSRQAPAYSLRLGRQQVVWGKADGLRLLDVVNPLDLREFILDDYTDRRIPLWMVNAELFRGDQSFQLLVIPDLAFDRPAPAGGEFSLVPDLGAPPAPIATRPLAKPGGSPRNWEYGFKWGTLLGRLDLTFNALYGWDNSPVPERTVGPGGLELAPKAVRSRLVGVSGDLPVGPAVLRFEATFTPDDRREVAGADGLGAFAGRKAWRHVIGVDWIKDNWLISPQWFEERVVGGPRPVGGRGRSFVTLLVRRTFRQERMTLQLFSAYGFDHGDRWISPRLGYRFLGRIELTLGADLLGGDPAGLFGRFARRDRATLDTTVRF